jgi:murein DD-endopeptidase MepM/ murein hydrolase activator NlpD
MHNGVDLAGPYGTPIYATRAGVVTTASYEEGGAGWYVYINHGDGYGSIYMHMTGYTVYWGQQVQQGDIIGYLGSSGGSTGPHLHFGIWKNGVGYVNPAEYINFY